MSIVVIDVSPEIFWFVSGALSTLEIPLSHFTDSSHADKVVFNELPSIVILNGDDPNFKVEPFISKMRNHVFARNCMFIVFTSNLTVEYRRALIVNGAAYVFHKTMSHPPSQKHFLNTIKWLLELRNGDSNPFEAKFFPVKEVGTFTSWGRIGYISKTKCLIESNMDLNPGDSIPISTPLLEELGFKEAKFICTEKNTVGRYYQYANTFIGRIESKRLDNDLNKLDSWIKDNMTISKVKPVKILYFETDAAYRSEITKMIKLDKKYCARGYNSILNFDKILNYQLPNLILINRNIIQKDKQKFDALKKFMKNHFCFCVTYAHDETTNIQEFKKDYPQMMHIQHPINNELLESMVLKMEAKIPADANTEDKVFFNKHSPYSRVNFHTDIEITGVSEEGVQIKMPYSTSSFCSAEIESYIFSKLKIHHFQFLRTVETSKKGSSKEGCLQKLIFIASSNSEIELLKQNLLTLEEELKK